MSQIKEGLGTLLHPRAATRAVHDANRPRFVWHQQLVTCLLATVLVEGLTMDAWAHLNQTKLDTVVTPWHGLFYGGFFALSVWIFWHIEHHHGEGHTRLAAIPIGYGVAVVGMGIFFVAGLGDQIWHLTFGIERNLKAFLSPTHIGLVIGMVMIVSAPWRSMWSDPRIPRAPSFLQLLPVVWSLGLTVLLISNISGYILIFPSDIPTIGQAAFVSHFPGNAPAPLLDVFSARFQVQGVLMIEMTNLLMMVGVLLGLRRWRLPFGSITLIWTMLVASALVSYQYNKGWTVVAAIIGGLIADYLVLRLRPSIERPAAFRLFAGLAPAALWTTYFLVLAIAYHVGWPIELAVGVIVLSSLMSVMVAYAMVPPEMPVIAAAEPVTLARAPSPPVVPAGDPAGV
ncbi:MAG TPA: hypothetical protein VG294_16815 [Solirubrobacteraceae bacterium]|nr:hypothetical protein [Solirubrobacteraceae bacterium]